MPYYYFIHSNDYFFYSSNICIYAEDALGLCFFIFFLFFGFGAVRGLQCGVLEFAEPGHVEGARHVLAAVLAAADLERAALKVGARGHQPPGEEAPSVAEMVRGVLCGAHNVDLWGRPELGLGHPRQGLEEGPLGHHHRACFARAVLLV